MNNNIRFNKQIALYDWIVSFPDESRERLESINRAATTARHVLLALTFGIYDQYIRRVNKLIIQLLLTRMRAERNSDQRMLDSVQLKLTDIHVAIDWATGVLPLYAERVETHTACNRIRGEGG